MPDPVPEGVGARYAASPEACVSMRPQPAATFPRAALRVLGGLCLLGLSGCWNLERSIIEGERFPWQPDSGVPDGWSVERIDTGVRCPAGEAAPLFVVSPDAVDPRVVDDAPRLPVALIFTSGAFDYIIDPPTGDPLSGQTWRETRGEIGRLGIGWAADRAFEAIGMLPNTDPVERHAGSLPGALAAKGIASVIVPNCWGDLWHNRSGVADNLYRFDGFVREGRTLAEFAYLHTTSAFPPGNPIEMPFKAQLDRVFMVGLGEGSRAIAELLKLSDGSGAPSYPAAAVVADSPEDDLSLYYAPSGAADLTSFKTGLDRIHEGGVNDVGAGSLAELTAELLPARVGVLAPAGDSAIVEGANDLLLERLDALAAGGRAEVWRWTPPIPAHVLTNADPDVAKAVADFLGDGLDAVPSGLRDDG